MIAKFRMQAANIMRINKFNHTKLNSPYLNLPANVLLLINRFLQDQSDIRMEFFFRKYLHIFFSIS